MEAMTATGNGPQPGLVFFYSSVSGQCRRVEGFLAQVLQRRRNHGTFRLYRVDEEDRPDLLQRFDITSLPTLVVLQDKHVGRAWSGRVAAATSSASSRPG